jgi:uncharacterized protein (TIGR00730 family)
VIGVIPNFLETSEIANNNVTELVRVETMHDRKIKMHELSDGIITLPGGWGTMDEMFEMLTWNTLNIHDKKIVLLNSNGFYDHLIAHIQTMFTQGFLYDDWRKRLLICSSPEEIISFLV